jgi:hypothetical protein
MNLTAISLTRPAATAPQLAPRFREKNAICLEVSAQPAPVLSARRQTPFAHQSALYLMAQMSSDDRASGFRDPAMVAQSYQTREDVTGAAGFAARV